MRIKRLLSMACAGCILLGLIGSANAMEISWSQEKQTSYLAQFDTIQSNDNLTDNDKIEQVLNLYFSTKAANYKDDESNIDMSFFIDSNNNDFNENKILNSLKLQKKLRQESKSNITSDNLTLNYGTINVTGNSASVVVYENYTYQVQGIDKPSVNGITYGINLTKTDGKWLIMSVTSDDETYSDAMGSDTYSVDKVIQDGKAAEAIDLSASTITNSSSSAEAQSAVSPLSTIIYYSYDRSDASTYAYNHTCNDGSSSTTTNYNLTQFPHYNPYDCMNFASQCIWAGFSGAYTFDSTYVTPMLYDWYSYKTSGASSSWISTSAFWSLVTSTPGATYLSTNNYSSGVAYAQPGDIIQIYSSSDGWYHTYVVYAVTGTTGSRTTSNIWICAHTSNRQNVQLSTVWSGATRTISINGQYNYM